MIAALLSALGVTRIARSRQEQQNARRVRWRGSDGRWHWQVA